MPRVRLDRDGTSGLSGVYSFRLDQGNRVFLFHSVTTLKSVASVEHIAHAVCKTFVDQNCACERIKAGVLLLAHWVICLVIIQS